MNDTASKENTEFMEPPELRRYVESDFAPARESLSQCLESENLDGDQPIHLTDGADGGPRGITPQMNSWFSLQVAPRRNAAIAAVCGQFAADTIRGVPTVFFEYERDRIAAETKREKSAVVVQFERSMGAARREADDARLEFETELACQAGRQPRMVSPALYAIGLLLILLLEFPINLDGFLRWLHTPMFATGATLVVAAMIGAASHFHGTLLRQYDWYFGPHDKTRRLQGAKLLVMGSVLLSVALVLAGAARYFFMLPEIRRIILTGGNPPSMVTTVVILLASNVGVYLVGAAWAFITHDEIPDYPSKKRKADRLRARLDSAFRKQVKEELDRLDQKAAAEMRKLAARDGLQKTSPRYLRNREFVAALQERDGEVVGALADYRARLARRANGTLFIFRDDTITSQECETVLTAEKWAASPLSLNLHSAFFY
jgi:hypothetical protein